MTTVHLLRTGDALFSKTQQKVLGLLFGKPEQSYYTNEIVRHAGLGKGTVMRELERLEAAGLVQLSKQGNQIHYQANATCPIFNELVAITRKTFGIGDTIKSLLEPLQSKIHSAFIYGSIAKNTANAASDIDVMLIGENLSYGAIMELLEPAEHQLGRTINPSIYTPEDFHTKLAAANHFLTRIMEQPRIQILGEIFPFDNLQGG